jgi:3-hydroxyisobutyrate dehydrogenase-like beta-hydroxyacid dehydrogenase
VARLYRRDSPFFFKLEHMLKDVRLCLEHGQAVGAPFQSAAWAREITQRSESDTPVARSCATASVRRPRSG